MSSGLRIWLPRLSFVPTRWYSSALMMSVMALPGSIIAALANSPLEAWCIASAMFATCPPAAPPTMDMKYAAVRSRPSFWLRTNGATSNVLPAPSLPDRSTPSAAGTPFVTIVANASPPTDLRPWKNISFGSFSSSSSVNAE